MRNYQNTQPEDNPLTDDYEVRMEEYHERGGNLQYEHVRRKEESLELQEQWEAEYCLQEEHRDEETLQDKIKV